MGQSSPDQRLFLEMCRATVLSVASIDNSLHLLQSWTWWRLPFLHPKHRKGCSRTTGSSALAEDAPLVATQYSCQFAPLIPIQLSNPIFFSQAPPYYGPSPHVIGYSIPADTYFVKLMSPTYYTPMQMLVPNPMSGQTLTYALPPMTILMQATDDDIDVDAHSAVDDNVNAWCLSNMLGI
ncbi:hypothetical protein PVK06_043833 [Gossypium arboreum]|uniref:Uncharacterized protein n=1 Tax=Gossypium arboreum TaxID=29729 RepID=A0ABR0MS27_GOSAR|nr:hypothetical protein PVK06_043833 [Gossypium arboreum]